MMKNLASCNLLFGAVMFINCFIYVMSDDIATDQSALLSVKEQLTLNPDHVLVSNWSNATLVCSWIGVTCGMQPRRVTRLNMTNMGLKGRVPPQLGNLSSLVYLELRRNRFTGDLPRELGNLRNIDTLFLEDNQLTGLFDGIGGVMNLTALGLTNNRLTGSFPVSILNISSLERLSLRSNLFTGVIPREIGNLSMLETIFLDRNTFTGSIPEEMGYLQRLVNIYMSHNSLNGSIPPAIFNISTLGDIGFTSNELSGSLPSDMGNRLPNLKALLLNLNYIGGVVPDSISNASQLGTISLRLNRFTGPFPGSLGKLRNLTFLSLARNNITTDSSSFIDSLTNCNQLKYLIINNNPLDIVLPASIGNLSSTVENIYASECLIKGSIPDAIGNLSGLTLLDISDNDLSGFIPSSIRLLQSLQQLVFIHNRIRGTFPSSLCELRSLGMLQASRNEISGSIPDCFGNITSFRYIALDSNHLTSGIPSTLWNLIDLLNLNVSSNFLNGSIPDEVQNLEAAVAMDFSFNQFTGGIPSTLGSMVTLVNLSLAGNSLQGHIPESLGELISLEQLDISNNSFSGMIPRSLENLQHLKAFNVSFNRLSGEIPDGGSFVNFSYSSFMSNEAFCGAPRFHVPPCENRSRRKRLPLIAVISIVIASAILAAIVLYIILLKKRGRKAEAPVNGLSIINVVERVPYHQLLSATNGFDENNLLGVGSSGSVYRANFSDGTCVAVKVFNLQLEAALTNFDTECEVLRNLRHRNLTKVISSCVNLEFKALVLEFMPNGSLDKWLYADDLFLNLMQRLNIVIDVASAMEYLHHGYTKPVAHCDLKPANVLLDTDMVGHVTDFGIAKLLGDVTTVHTRTLATLGYIAPGFLGDFKRKTAGLCASILHMIMNTFSDYVHIFPVEYGTEGLVSTRCDVYSYGIMLMETFTRRSPSDQMFDEELSLKRWVHDSVPAALGQVIDPDLLEVEREHLVEKLECLSSIMELALICSSDTPAERMNMKDVVAALTKIKLRIVPFCRET